MPWRNGSTATRLGSELETTLRTEIELDRQRRVRNAQGLIAEVMPRGEWSVGGSIASGTCLFEPIELLAGDNIANIVIPCNAVGSGLTLGRFGIYNAAGAQLAASSEVSASFASTGDKEIAVAYNVAVKATYYLGFIFVGTTPPTFLRYQGAGSAGLVGTGTVPMTWTQAGQADLPANATFVAGINAVFWMGVK